MEVNNNDYVKGWESACMILEMILKENGDLSGAELAHELIDKEVSDDGNSWAIRDAEPKVEWIKNWSSCLGRENGDNRSEQS